MDENLLDRIVDTLNNRCAYRECDLRDIWEKSDLQDGRHYCYSYNTLNHEMCTSCWKIVKGYFLLKNNPEYVTILEMALLMGALPL